MDSLVQRARAFLDTTQNPDGGWGYRVGSDSVTEPTALAVLARPSPGTWEKGVDWLLDTQREDGGWGVNAQDDASNWLTAWATWTLSLVATGEAREAIERGVDWLLDVRVVRTTDPETVANVIGSFGIDLTLAGWPWQPGEAPFVEPTALGMLTLFAARLGDHQRLAEGVAYLKDRACLQGGWNVGNPVMFDKPLPPTPYNTALALLALKAAGVDRKEPVITEGLKILGEIITQPVKVGSIAWSLIALQAWQAGDDAALDRLSPGQSDDGGWEDSPYATSSALVALQGPETIFFHE